MCEYININKKGPRRMRIYLIPRKKGPHFSMPKLNKNKKFEFFLILN